MKQCNAGELLEKTPDHGFPGDYLLSRIKGRRARLVSGWNALVTTPSPLEHLPDGHYQKAFDGRNPEAVWRALLGEYRWLYHQMNGRLRETLSPFFLYTELRTLFICLRYVRELKGGRSREILTQSLLCDELRRILGRSQDGLSAAMGIEENFLCLSGQFRGIAEIMQHEGLKSFERELTERFLSVIVRSVPDPALTALFMRLIDARNILATAKLLKTATQVKHHFIPGGTVDTGRLMEILQAKTVPGADRLLREWTGEEVTSSDLIGVEASLYRGISRSLKRYGREPLGTGPILDYLWKCSIEAMNLAILSYGHKLKRDVVAAELVQ
ncbi:MAG: V-type ATPase subunit [Nitrospiraceae bacterium]|nr:V-type ATPase subunit [Nitrospiraceae bacterium]